MSIKIETEYRGYILSWDDWNRTFIISKDGTEVKRMIPTLADCEKWIDQKEKQVFKRVPVLHDFWGKNGIVKAEATSVVDKDYVWVVSGKERAKERASNIWLDTPENQEIVNTIIKKEKEIESLKAEIKTLKGSTERLSIDMLIIEADKP